MSYYVSPQPFITADSALRHLAGMTNDASARWMLEQLAEACGSIAALNTSLQNDIDRWESFAEKRVDGPLKSPEKAAETFDRMVRERASMSESVSKLEATVKSLRAQIVELTSPATEPTPEPEVAK